MVKSLWNQLAQRQVQKLITAARKIPELKKRCPAVVWSCEVHFISQKKMTELNARYRKKAYPTDVLSFSPPSVFFEAGALGELVICLPVLRSQAQAIGHSERRELSVLLAHGLLHLLGYDHEIGKRQAATMSKWERKLLRAILKSSSEAHSVGLIGRAR